jgi:hypothetical protein
MARAFWKSGWQEGSFARIRGFVASSPAWFREISPSDAVEDSYLLTVASTLFLKDEQPVAPAGPAAGLAGPAHPPALPVGVPPFSYERCVGSGAEASEAFAAATSGRFGAFHRESANGAENAESWVTALAALRRAGALKSEWPAPRMTHLPPPGTFAEDLKACNQAVFRKAIHAFKIGFGLWGRWEPA